MRYFKPGDVIKADQFNESFRRATDRLRIMQGGKFGDAYLPQQTMRARTGSAAYEVPIVSVLPPIPSVGMAEVFWIGPPNGTGDNQVWRAYAGQTKWTPTQYYSLLDGTPE